MANRFINCSSEAVEKLYLESDWGKVFKQRRAIRIPTQCPLSIDDYVQDQPSSVWEIIDRDGIQVIENDPFLINMNQKSDSVLSHAKDIFVVDRDTAEPFSNNETGTCVFREEREQLELLKIHWEESLKANSPYTWRRFFTDFGRSMSIMPSNSLIIIDRYLFASPFDAGLLNLKCLLSELLPSNFSSDYHILIVADPNQFSRGKDKYGNPKIVPLEQAAKEINDTVESISRPYSKTIELLAIVKFSGKALTKEEKIQYELYNDTHNRRIISNSFIIRAEHGFDAIKIYENKEKHLKVYQAKHAQTIWFDAIYSGIDNKYQDYNVLPVKPCDDIIEVLRKVKRPNGDSIARYFINGSESHPQKIKNRLLQ